MISLNWWKLTMLHRQASVTFNAKILFSPGIGRQYVLATTWLELAETKQCWFPTTSTCRRSSTQSGALLSRGWTSLGSVGLFLEMWGWAYNLMSEKGVQWCSRDSMARNWNHFHLFIRHQTTIHDFQMANFKSIKGGQTPPYIWERGNPVI